MMLEDLPRNLPPRRKVDHKIELESRNKPPAYSSYQMDPPKLDKLRKQLKELLEAGYIRPSKEPYGALVLFQRRKMGCCAYA